MFFLGRELILQSYSEEKNEKMGAWEEFNRG